MQTRYLPSLLRMAVLFFALLPVFAWSHSPSISGTYLTEKSEGYWVLQVRSSIVAFEHEIKTRFSAENYKDIDDFKKLAIRVVTDSIVVSFDDETVTLNDPKIRVGHETVVAFKIHAPQTAKGVSIKNTSFVNVFKSRSVMTLTLKDGKRERATLDKANGFMAEFWLESH